jgi:hypothetical protein
MYPLPTTYLFPYLDFLEWQQKINDVYGKSIY